MSVVWPLVKPYSPTGSVNQAALDTAYVDPLNDLNDRLSDTGWLTNGVVAAAGSSTILAQSARRIGSICYLAVVYHIGSTLTPGGDGDVTNTHTLTVTDSRFIPSSGLTVNQALRSGASGRLATHVFELASPSLIDIAAVSGTGVINSGDTLSIADFYFVG